MCTSKGFTISTVGGCQADLLLGELLTKEKIWSILFIEDKTLFLGELSRYHIGLRYTGNSRMVFALTLKFGFIPIKIPVAIRGLDLDGEVWVKLRLIPTEPWVGTATWAFVSLPKVTLALAPFRLLNLMGMYFIRCFHREVGSCVGASDFSTSRITIVMYLICACDNFKSLILFFSFQFLCFSFLTTKFLC